MNVPKTGDSWIAPTGYLKNDVFIYIATIFIYPPHQSPYGDSFSTKEKPIYSCGIRNHALLNTKRGLVFDSVGCKRLPPATIAPTTVIWNLCFKFEFIGEFEPPISRLNISGDRAVFAQNFTNFMQKASLSPTVPLIVQSVNFGTKPCGVWAVVLMGLGGF